MSNLIVARALLFMLISTQAVSVSGVKYSSLVGKRTVWDVDTDLNGYFDTKITMENITALTSIVDGIDDLECDLSEESGGAIISMSGSPLHWEGIDLVASNDSMQPSDPIVAVGIARVAMYLSKMILGVNFNVTYDNSTRLLISVLNPSITYIYIKETDVFITAESFTPLMIALAIVFLSVIVVYIVGMVITDKKKYKIKAKFDQKFWNS